MAGIERVKLRARKGVRSRRIRAEERASKFVRGSRYSLASLPGRKYWPSVQNRYSEGYSGFSRAARVATISDRARSRKIRTLGLGGPGAGKLPVYSLVAVPCPPTAKPPESGLTHREWGEAPCDDRADIHSLRAASAHCVACFARRDRMGRCSRRIRTCGKQSLNTMVARRP